MRFIICHSPQGVLLCSEGARETRGPALIPYGRIALFTFESVTEPRMKRFKYILMRERGIPIITSRRLNIPSLTWPDARWGCDHKRLDIGSHDSLKVA